MRRLLLAFTALALAFQGFSAPAKAEDVLTRAYVVRRALGSSPALVAAEARVRAADARVRATGALPDPMVSARIWGVPTRFDAQPTQTMLMAEQSFPLARVREAGERVAREDVASSAADREVVSHVVAREAELMLVDVCEADAMQRAIAESRALFSRLRDVASARTLVMPEDAVDVALLDVALARVAASFDEAQLLSSARRQELATMLDVPVESLGACGELDLVVTADEQALVLEAIEARPELTQLAAERRRAEAMGTSARAMSAPMLRLGAGVMLMAPGGAHGGQTDRVQWMFEVGSTIPSFRGARRGRYAEAQAMAEEAEAMRLDLARMIEREVRRRVASREGARVRATSLAGPVRERLERALSVAITRYRIDGDVAAVLEVLRMSREIAEARVVADHALVREDVMLAHAVGLGLPESP